MHIRVKLLKGKNKEQILKAARENGILHREENDLINTFQWKPRTPEENGKTSLKC